MTTGTATAREITRELRSLRRGHAGRSIWQAVEQGYVWLFGVLMICSVSGAAVARVWSDLSACETASCEGDRRALLLMLGIGLFTLGLRSLIAFGPIVAGRAGATWLLSTPVDRGGLLRGRALALSALAALAGAGTLTVLVGPGAPDLATLGLGFAVGAVGGFVLATLAIVLQLRPRLRRVAQLACDVLLLGVLAGTPLLLASRLSLPGVAAVPLIVAGAVLALIACAVGVAAFGGLAGMSRRELVAGGELLSGLSGAAASMDTTMISDLLVHRRFRRLGSAPSRRGRLRGLAAISVRELVRMLRSPQRLIVAVGLLALPYAVAHIGVPSAVPVALVAAGYLAVRPWGGGLHAVARSGGLRRAFPAGDRLLRLAFAAPVLAASLVWSLAAVPALSLGAPAGGAVPAGWAAWIAVTATIAAGVVRSSTRPTVRYDGPLISTPAGALPAGFVGQVFRGPDVLLAGILPLVFLPPMVAMFVPLIALGYLLGTRRL